MRSGCESSFKIRLFWQRWLRKINIALLKNVDMLQVWMHRLRVRSNRVETSLAMYKLRLFHNV